MATPPAPPDLDKQGQNQDSPSASDQDSRQGQSTDLSGLVNLAAYERYSQNEEKDIQDSTTIIDQDTQNKQGTSGVLSLGASVGIWQAKNDQWVIPAGKGGQKPKDIEFCLVLFSDGQQCKSELYRCER